MNPDDARVPALSREEILTLLAELGADLDSQGLHGDLYVVGGAAIAITLDRRRTTRDVDAALHPADAVRAAAARVAAAHALPTSWLNPAAMAFAPATADDDAVGLELRGLSVSVAGPEHLLAMKLAAGRARDLSDLAVLFRALRIADPHEALAIARRHYGEESVVLSDPDESYLWLAEDVLRLIAAQDDARDVVGGSGSGDT